MEDKELMTEKQTEVQSRTATAILEKEEEKPVDKSKINLQKLREELEREKQFKAESKKKERAVVETPNYDFIKEISPEKRKKIYKIEKTQSQTNVKPFTFSKKLKFILFSIVFIIGGAFCISSGVQLLDASNALNAAQTQYEISLAQLIKKMSKIDSGNNLLELIETYPTELLEPSSIAESSNWFDKICNFISGLFGG
jgi:hypothetical protein